MRSPGPCLRARPLAARAHRGGECHRTARRGARRAASAAALPPRAPGSAHTIQWSIDLLQRRGDRGGILVGEHPDHGEGACRAVRARRQRTRAQLRGEHLRGRLVVRDVQDPLHLARHNLEAPGQVHAAQRPALRSPP